jgi:fructose-1-phosphate kinase PfkB-like protein
VPGSAYVIDAAGEVLAAALDAGEGLVVPNLTEAETVIHGPRPEAVDPHDAPERAVEAVNHLLRLGAHRAIVTAGAAYAEQGPHAPRGWVSAPDVAARNPIGAGDAFAAGLGLRLESGARLDDAVMFGAAVASAHVEAPSEIEPRRVGELAGPHTPSGRARDLSPDGALT